MNSTGLKLSLCELIISASQGIIVACHFLIVSLFLKSPLVGAIKLIFCDFSLSLSLSLSTFLLVRVIWFLAIMCMTCLVIRTLRTVTSDYEMYAFSSRLHFQSHRSLAFPAVTVCNSSPYDFSKLDHLLGGLGNKRKTVLKQLRALMDERVRRC